MERDRHDMVRLAAWIGAIVVGIFVVIGVASWVIGAVLDKPVLAEPAYSAPTPAAGATATPAPAAAAEPTMAAVAAKPKPKPVSNPKRSPKPAVSANPASTSSLGVVVIDPGHQGRGNPTQEPIGPGATETKPAVASGATGGTTHIDESVINLAVSLKLRDELERRGVKVIMVRTSQDVNIPNSKRAQIANNAHADLFVRVHCDDVTNHSIHGFLTMVPQKNRWTGPIVAESAKAGRFVQDAAVAATGAYDRGLMPTSTMSGFNWSKVPSIIVEMGVMSYPAEDRKLATDAYQRTLAKGIADGVVEYLKN